VLQKDCQDDLFLSDGWFTLAPETTNDKTEDEGLGCNKEEPANNDDVLTFENEGVLDFASENEFPEEDQVTDIDMDDRNSSNGSQQVTFAGFCRVLCDQGLRTNSNETVDGILPYKAAALGGLSSLLQSLCPSAESSSQQAVVSQQRAVYQLLVPRLFAFVKEKGAKPPPPLLIAKSLESLASAMYNGVGNNPSSDYDNALVLLRFLSTETDQAAWTVRQTSALAAASLVANMASTVLRKNDVITTVLECASKSLNDRKFWRVRQAGLELILSLVSRVGKQRVSDVDSESQLLMEAILPYKEKIIDIARQSLRDNESQVTATASKITLTLAWWP
jgi:proteasome component ECM29